MLVGTLKLRNSRTKQSMGAMSVSVRGHDAVLLNINVGHPDVELEMPPDIAIALADLLMEATCPSGRSKSQKG